MNLARPQGAFGVDSFSRSTPLTSAPKISVVALMYRNTSVAMRSSNGRSARIGSQPLSGEVWINLSTRSPRRSSLSRLARLPLRDAGRGPDGRPLAKGGKPGTGLPDWFTALDADADGQVSLFEWRKGGKDMTVYAAMDLNGDGLLTRGEYLRFAKMNEDALKQKMREDRARDDK